MYTGTPGYANIWIVLTAVREDAYGYLAPTFSTDPLADKVDARSPPGASRVQIAQLFEAVTTSDAKTPLKLAALLEDADVIVAPPIATTDLDEIVAAGVPTGASGVQRAQLFEAVTTSDGKTPPKCSALLEDADW